MMNWLKIWLRQNWKSVCGFCAVIFLWLLIKENILGLSWGYLLFGGIEFDGIDDNVRIPASVDWDFGAGDVTWAFWLKYGTISNGRKVILAYTDLINANGNETIMPMINGGPFDTNDRKVHFFFRPSGSTFFDLVSNNALDDGEWHHHCFTRSGNTAIYYVDAIENDRIITINPASTLGKSDEDLAFGRWYVLGKLPGTLKEVSILKGVALALAEVERLHNPKVMGMPLRIRSNFLASYWPIDDGPDGEGADGDVVRDLSGNGHNGIGNNGANNTGLIWRAEEVLSYLDDSIYSIFSVIEGLILLRRRIEGY